MYHDMLDTCMQDTEVPSHMNPLSLLPFAYLPIHLCAQGPRILSNFWSSHDGRRRNLPYRILLSVISYC